MAQVGRKRFIPFRIADVAGDPVLGRVLGDFQVTFLRDGVTCHDGLTVEESGSGLYCLTYTPTAVGQDYVELYDTVHDLRISDDESIDDTLLEGTVIFALTQDTGGVGALKADVRYPQTFTLYVFKSQVWQSGDHNSLSATAFTHLDASGNWLTTPLLVLRDVYHVVLMNSLGETHVIRSFFDLRPDEMVSAPMQLAGDGTIEVINEIPSGACDGVNVTFGLAAVPVAGTVQVFLNGMLLEAGVGNDYTLSGNTVTLLYPPVPGGKIAVRYRKNV
ncbi:hypothetical protein D4R30_00240 [archaeon]|nr:MAG: hypothetical protein D4R30_00240 [archaeon]